MKLTEGLAIYAAILSTGNFLWNLYQNRPNHSVSIGLAFYEDSGKTTVGIAMTAMNPSPKTDHLQSFSLLVGGSRAGIMDKLKSFLNYKRFVG